MLIYLHGGGNHEMSATPFGDQNIVDALASRGVLVVTLNYRLHFLGDCFHEPPLFRAPHTELELTLPLYVLCEEKSLRQLQLQLQLRVRRPLHFEREH